MKKIAALLYPNFTALDAIGPLEVLARLPEAEIHYVSLSGGPVSNGAGLTIMTEPLSEIDHFYILLISGGWGSRKAVKEQALLEETRKAAGRSDYVLTVCTGSALAAAAGLLDGRKATGNKKAFDWTASMGPEVLWNRDARWTKDGKYYTAGGVSAGIDMALGFTADIYGKEKALFIAEAMEFRWNENPEEGWCFH